MDYAKGSAPSQAEYAKGGGVTERTRNFMKEPDTFRTDKENSDYAKTGATGKLAQPTGDKCLPAIKPRS